MGSHLPQGVGGEEGERKDKRDNVEATQKLILMIKCNIRVRSTLPNLRIRSQFLTIEGVRSQKIEIPPIWPSLKKKKKT